MRFKAKIAEHDLRSGRDPAEGRLMPCAILKPIFHPELRCRPTLIRIKADGCAITDVVGQTKGGSMTNWPEFTVGLNGLLRDLRSGAPGIMKAFAGIAQAATASKALDSKTKELIALGIAVAVRCDDCIAFHVKAALEHGATKDEVSETLGMAIYMGAGPSVMYASHAFEAFNQFEASKRAAP